MQLKCSQWTYLIMLPFVPSLHSVPDLWIEGRMPQLLDHFIHGFIRNLPSLVPFTVLYVNLLAILVEWIVLAVSDSAPLLLIEHEIVHNLPLAIIARCARLLPNLVKIGCRAVVTGNGNGGIKIEDRMDDAIWNINCLPGLL